MESMKHSKICVADLISMSSLSLLACENGDVNVGDGSPVEGLGAALEDYQGTWEGYVEAFTFPDGSDRVKVDARRERRWTARGRRFTRGASADGPRGRVSAGCKRDRSRLNPAFAYSVLDAAVSERRIRLNVSVFEPYQSYCAILDPIWSDLAMAHLCTANDGCEQLADQQLRSDVCLYGRRVHGLRLPAGCAFRCCAHR